MVLRTEPLITPILTATAGRHALVAAARAVVKGAAERGGTGAGATPGGSAGGVGSAWTTSGSPAVVRRARLQGWVVAAGAPTAFQHVQPLLQAADDLVQLPGPWRCPAPSVRARRPWRCESSRPCPCLPRARGTAPSCGGGRSTARWNRRRRSLVGRRGPQGVLQEGLCRVRPVQGVLPRPVVHLQGVHLVGVLQGVLMVLRQGVLVGLRRVASVGPRMGASSCSRSPCHHPRPCRPTRASRSRTRKTPSSGREEGIPHSHPPAPWGRLRLLRQPLLGDVGGLVHPRRWR